MKRCVVVGTQWGDEGKGKITDFLAQHVDVVVRYQGGNNAGHTVVFNEQKHSLHLLPSGILNPSIANVMANGMVINPQALVKELASIRDYSLLISDRAHVVLPYHIAFDRLNEAKKGSEKIGTTHKGIGPAYSDKAARVGMRMGTFVSETKMPVVLKQLIAQKNEVLKGKADLVDEEQLLKVYEDIANQIRPMVTDTSLFLNEAIKANKTILFEGAQGVMLCMDHGSYPYVTSSSPTAASVPLNTGIAPWLIEGAVGVAKAYTTRVGEGPLPSEISSKLADRIREVGHEFGTTTGRPRRIGWLDTVVLRYSKRVSGLTHLAVTLLDVLTGIDPIHIVTGYEYRGEIIDTIPSDIDEYQACKPIYLSTPGWKEDITQVTSFDELPEQAKQYLHLIETYVGLKVAIFSVGPDRNQTIVIEDVIG